MMDQPTRSLPDEMRIAAEESLQRPVCMFCGEKHKPEDLVSAQDWDGNEGRACPTCADNQEEA